MSSCRNLDSENGIKESLGRSLKKCLDEYLTRFIYYQNVKSCKKSGKKSAKKSESFFNYQNEKSWRVAVSRLLQDSGKTFARLFNSDFSQTSDRPGSDFFLHGEQ